MTDIAHVATISICALFPPMPAMFVSQIAVLQIANILI